MFHEGYDMSLDLKDLIRMQKQGWKMDEGGQCDPDATSRERLAGITREQRMRTRNVRDIIDIGSGTRCKHCGMLHFLYLERCGACSKPMEYNLGKTEVNV